MLLDAAGSIAPLSDQEGVVARLVPTSALLDTDVQSVGVLASTASTLRGLVTTDANVGERSFVLPPRIDTVEFGADDEPASASWSGLPDMEFDTAQLAASDDTTLVQSTASRRWLETTGSSSLGLDISAPGFETRWILRNGQASRIRFQLEKVTETTAINTVHRR